MEIFPFKQYQLPPDSPPDTAFPSGHTFHAPLIEIKVKNGNQITPDVAVLIDSGAGYCIFGLDVAQILNIKVTSGNLKRLQALGSTVDAYFFDVQLLIKNITVNCYAGFLNQTFPQGLLHVGLLGDYDFLSKYPVTLDVLNNEIKIG